MGDSGAPSGLPAVQWTQGSPYLGLEAFGQDHSDVFFGRTAAIEGVLDAVRRQHEAGSGLVLVLGASGSGKSSLVHAGVLPLLTTPGVVEVIGLWREAFFRPSFHGGNLLGSFAAALFKEGALPDLADPEVGDPIRELTAQLERHPEAFSPEESDFVAASRQRLTEAERRQRRLRRVVMTSMALLTILAVVGFLDARHGRSLQEAAARRELQARQRAETTVDAAAGFMLDLLGPADWVRRLQEKDLALTEEFLKSSDAFVSALGSQEHSLALLEAWSKAMASLAGSLQGQGKFDEAIAVQRRAVEVQERIARAMPEHPIVQTHLATQRYVLGQLHRLSQEPRQAEAVFEEALAKLESAIGSVDPSDRMRDMWLTLQNALSATLTQHGRPEEGDARFAETVRRLTEWTRGGVGEKDWSAVLADTWMRRADSKIMIDANAEAEEALRRAEEAVAGVTSESDRRAYAKPLLQAWASLETNRGNFARAAEIYGEWHDMEEANPPAGKPERLHNRYPPP